MKQFFSLVFFGILFSSCAKTSDPEPASTANFKITGVKDVDLSTTSNASVTLPLSVVPLGSAKDTVLLRMDGLPKGMGYTVSPLSGATPFNVQLSLFTDFSGIGGSFPVRLTGVGRSGEVSYTFNVTVPSYRGWVFDGILYKQTGFVRNNDSVKKYASIRVYGGGNGQLTISFPKGRSFPTKTSSYSITAGALDSSNNIQISFYDDTQIYSATGNATGTFLVDTLGKLVFKCSNVEMSNGLTKKILSVDAAEQ
ncbi:MAG: hypothetical protein JST36_01215 [Bacteroidetes bacterium]|nr:hypothetical protein [Bacteroidota bacterium]